MALGAGVAAATLVLHVRDPHVPGSYGLCPWLLLTGTYCPGCGGLRAIHHLTDGDVVSAASSNLLLVVLVPFLVVGWAVWLSNGWRGTARVVPPAPAAATALVVAAALAFTVARNLPAGAWLTP